MSVKDNEVTALTKETQSNQSDLSSLAQDGMFCSMPPDTIGQKMFAGIPITIFLQRLNFCTAPH